MEHEKVAGREQVRLEELRHEFSCPDGELDEFFVADASVHIERMDDTAFWIGIYPPEESRLPRLMVNTGVHTGTWYFNVEVDSLTNHEFLSVRRPRSASIEPMRKVEREILRLRGENASLRAQLEAINIIACGEEELYSSEVQAIKEIVSQALNGTGVQNVIAEGCLSAIRALKSAPPQEDAHVRSR